MTAPITDDELVRVGQALDATAGDNGARFSRWVVDALYARVIELKEHLAGADQAVDVLDGELLEAQAELDRLRNETEDPT